MTDATRIPMLDLGSEIDGVWDELVEAFERVMRSGRFILGPEVEAFESEVAAYLGVKHAVGVNSGTDALVIALRALGIGPGDEVVTTPFTFFATPESISNVGATPVFVDIDPGTFNLDPELIDDAITERTKAILPVHLYGQPCDMDMVMKVAQHHDLRVLEDCAQAMGASWRGRRVGSFADVAAFSFFPSKNLGGFGDGGLVVTNRDDVNQSARLLRAHGSRRKYVHEAIGYNSRLDEMQAALLRVRLGGLDAANAGRRDAASRYYALLSGAPDVIVPYRRQEAEHVFHQYTLRVPERDRVRAALLAQGIETACHYPVPAHRSAPYAGRALTLPHAESAAEEVLSLPIGPSIEGQAQDAVARALMAL